MPTGHPEVDKGLNLFSADLRLAFKEIHHTSVFPPLLSSQDHHSTPEQGPWGLTVSVSVDTPESITEALSP